MVQKHEQSFVRKHPGPEFGAFINKSNSYDDKITPFLKLASEDWLMRQSLLESVPFQQTLEQHGLQEYELHFLYKVHWYKHGSKCYYSCARQQQILGHLWKHILSMQLSPLSHYSNRTYTVTPCVGENKHTSRPPNKNHRYIQSINVIYKYV